MDNNEFHHRLRRLIGRRCRYLGRNCRLIEVLSDVNVVVLSCDDGLPPIQGDQFGQPIRRAMETLQVALFGDDEENLSDDFLDLLHQLETAS